MNTNRTLEQKIKFDNGLVVGIHHIQLSKGNQVLDCLVEISTRGAVFLLKKPTNNNPTGWVRIRGDMMESFGGVILWDETKINQFFGKTALCVISLD